MEWVILIGVPLAVVAIALVRKAMGIEPEDGGRGRRQIGGSTYYHAPLGYASHGWGETDRDRDGVADREDDHDRYDADGDGRDADGGWGDDGGNGGDGGWSGGDNS
jgi:hypothetical protein